MHHISTSERAQTWASQFPLAKENSIHGEEFTFKLLAGNTSSSRRNEFLCFEQGSGMLITSYTIINSNCIQKLIHFIWKMFPINSDVSVFFLSKYTRGWILERTITSTTEAVLDTVVDTHLPALLWNFYYSHPYLVKYTS